MRLPIACLALAALALPAAAQQSGSPYEQALAGKLIAELNAGLACNAGLFKANADLAAAQARIKELEAELEARPAKP